MTDMSELRALAERAVPGYGPLSPASEAANFDYICALDPQTVLGLLDDIERLRTALTHCLGLIVEFGDLNGFRNMTDQELGSSVQAVAREAAEALNGSV